MKQWIFKSVGIILALFASGSFAQDKFYAYKGEPPDGSSKLENYTAISLDGIVVINPFDFYRRVIDENLGGVGPRLPSNLSTMMFSINYDYRAPSGDEFPHDIIWREPGLSIYRDTLPRGYYRNAIWNFFWSDSNGDDQSASVDFRGKLIIPTVYKIPVYAYMKSLNTGILRGDQPIAEMGELRNKFRAFGTDVSRIATNANGDLKNNFGCPSWFQFRFYGYVSGFDNGILEPGDLARLPPGITIVPQILYCGGYRRETAAGCATQGGTRIAIIAEAFSNPSTREDLIALHEIGHTLGLDHEETQPNLVMNEKGSAESVGILENECRAFSSKKDYVTPAPFEILL
jgi:hypothetical protein